MKVSFSKVFRLAILSGLFLLLINIPIFESNVSIDAKESLIINSIRGRVNGQFVGTSNALDLKNGSIEKIEGFVSYSVFNAVFGGGGIDGTIKY